MYLNNIIFIFNSLLILSSINTNKYFLAEDLLENLIAVNQNLPGIVHEANEKLLEIYRKTRTKQK